MLENALRTLAGRSFKLALRKHTDNTIKAVSLSAILTGILQSSSVVLMTVLAFVGAGIVSMRNAMAVSIGSHFGTTLDSWLVAAVGFKMDVSMIALPLVGVSCIILGLSNNGRKIHNVARMLLGIGFLFLGLDYMKESMSVVLKDFDFTQYEHLPRIAFVLIGFIITSLIQSSSATMAILLSALNTGAIPFETAVAAVIGSEFGAMTKVVLGSLAGNAGKRQLAAGNVAFNLVICTIAFIFLDSFVKLTALPFREDDVLMRLVLFQSTINIIGVFIFVPFLSPFTRLLEKHIHGKDEPSTFVIGEKLLQEPILAMEALEQDTELLIHRVMRLNLEAFATNRKVIHPPHAIKVTLDERNNKLKTFESRYDDVKKSEGEILIYALKLIERLPEQRLRIEQLVSAIRHAMHSSKAMKDVYHNRIEFYESADDIKFRQYIDLRNQLDRFYMEVDHTFHSAKQRPEILVEKARLNYNERRDIIYEAARREKLGTEDLSSLLNVNRELYTSCKTIVQALQLYHNSGDTNSIGDIP